MIRVGGYGDYTHMARIHTASFERGWSAEEIRELLDQPGGKSFVYEQDGKRAGFALVRFVADECEILAIAVDEAYKRRGIGRDLLAHVHFYSQRDGIHQVFLEVAEDNLAAIALYAGAGYVENGRRKGYYRRWHGRRVDALTMVCSLDA